MKNLAEDQNPDIVAMSIALRNLYLEGEKGGEFMTGFRLFSDRITG